MDPAGPNCRIERAVVVCPNRSATPLQLRRFVLALGVVCALVCAFSYRQGNVLAPLFGLLDMVVVTLLLHRVWRAADQSESVIWDGSEVRVEMRRGERVAKARFHPYWVRLERRPGDRRGDPERLFIASHGRRVELGRFLGVERRKAFADEVNELLASARNA